MLHKKAVKNRIEYRYRNDRNWFILPPTNGLIDILRFIFRAAEIKIITPNKYSIFTIKLPMSIGERILRR